MSISLPMGRKMDAARQPAAPSSQLTEQERRVLRLLSEGKDAAEVARALRITPRNHIHNANQKPSTKNRLETVIHAVRRGLI